MSSSFSFLCEIRGVRFANGWEKIRDSLPIAFFRDANNVSKRRIRVNIEMAFSLRWLHTLLMARACGEPL